MQNKLLFLLLFLSGALIFNTMLFAQNDQLETYSRQSILEAALSHAPEMGIALSNELGGG